MSQAIAFHTPDELKARIGQEIGLSDWVEVTQDMINRFADLTDDHQFIHVDPVLAAQTPFGGTIAHGFLVLSLLAKLGKAAEFVLQGVQMGVNYGFDKVRLMAPVKSGKRIRGRFVLKDLIERAPGQWLSTLAVSVEIEGESKPAIVAEWLGMQFVKQS
jgi:acyl dehydratase